jgi:molybdopterin/thiamine biosynthesis adenylyltransferase
MELCVERIKSCDPDIAIETFAHGLSKEKVADFVKDCDIIIEECDNFLVKFLVRQEAMTYPRPLLMATFQNEMMDVERYDIDEEARPFHFSDDIGEDIS